MVRVTQQTFGLSEPSIFPHFQRSQDNFKSWTVPRLEVLSAMLLVPYGV